MTIDINVQGDDKTTYRKGALFKRRVLVLSCVIVGYLKAFLSVVVAREFKRVCSDTNTILLQTVQKIGSRLQLFVYFFFKS